MENPQLSCSDCNKKLRAVRAAAPPAAQQAAMVESRLSTCRQCEHSTTTLGAEILIRCKMCGCFMEVKARFRHLHCAIDLW